MIRASFLIGLTTAIAYYGLPLLALLEVASDVAK